MQHCCVTTLDENVACMPLGLSKKDLKVIIYLLLMRFLHKMIKSAVQYIKK